MATSFPGQPDTGHSPAVHVPRLTAFCRPLQVTAEQLQAFAQQKEQHERRSTAAGPGGAGGGGFGGFSSGAAAATAKAPPAGKSSGAEAAGGVGRGGAERGRQGGGAADGGDDGGLSAPLQPQQLSDLERLQQTVQRRRLQCEADRITREVRLAWNGVP